MKYSIYKLSLFLSFVLLLFIQPSFAQEGSAPKYKDVVYFKNGSVFKGTIIKYEIGKELVLKMENNIELVIKDEYIKKIVQEGEKVDYQPKEEYKEKPYNFKEKGLYGQTSLGYIGGNEQFGNYVSGLLLHQVVGYQINRWVGAGVGGGVDFYNVNLGTIVPIYGEVRGYLRKERVSPYYAVAGGYGFQVLNDNSAWTGKEGGLYFHPSVGLRLGGNSYANMTIDLGLQWQKATYIQEFGDGVSGNEDAYTFKRFTFRIGVLF